MILAQLTEQTSITIGIGLATTAIVAAISCTWWVASKLNKLSNTMATILTRLDALEDGHFSKSEAAENAFRMAVANPDLNIPDPRNPGEFISVAPHHHHKDDETK